MLLFCLPPCLHADEWVPATIKEIFSNNRDFFVRITPGESLGETVGFKGAKVGKQAHAEFFCAIRTVKEGPDGHKSCGWRPD